MIDEVCESTARLAAIGLVAGLIFSPAAWAQSSAQNSGTHWLRMCTSPEANGQIECAVYVRALVEYDELRGKMPGQMRFFCPGKGVTIGQTRRVVLEFLGKNRQDLHLPFVHLAHRALAAAFPCTGDSGVGAGSRSPTQK